MDTQHGGREAIFLIGAALALTLTIFVGSFVVAAFTTRDPSPIMFAVGD